MIAYADVYFPHTHQHKESQHVRLFILAVKVYSEILTAGATEMTSGVRRSIFA